MQADTLTKWSSWLLIIALSFAGGGCETFKDDSLTGKLWQKDPTGTVQEHMDGNKYIYSTLTRTTLTPFAVAGDATMVGVALGAGTAVMVFAGACQAGSQSGGRVY